MPARSLSLPPPQRCQRAITMKARDGRVTDYWLRNRKDSLEQWRILRVSLGCGYLVGGISDCKLLPMHQAEA